MTKGKNSQNKRIIAIAGGKGGIGKSVTAANLAFAFVRNGKKVVIVNLDLGSDNTSTLLGIKESDSNISTFINDPKKNINDIITKTSYRNLGIIRGSSGNFKIANLKFGHKRRIINNLRKIEADYIILDLGSGFTFNTLDFFNCADEQILMFTPEPTSIKDVYSFIKCAIYRTLTKEFSKNSEVNFIIESSTAMNDDGITRKMNDLISHLYDLDKDLANIAMNMLSRFKPKLILNMVQHKKELSYANTILEVCKKFLNIDAEFFGIISYDDDVKKSVKMMKPLAVAFPRSSATKKLNVLCKKIIDSSKVNHKVFSKIKEVNAIEKYLFDMNSENYYKIVKKIPLYSSTITEVRCNECGEKHFYLPYQYNSGMISCKSCGYHMTLKEIYYSLNDRSRDILVNNDLTRGILETDHFGIN
ncbi:AAA family ATPase [Thermodesulfobacteriota bacterium]